MWYVYCSKVNTFTTVNMSRVSTRLKNSPCERARSGDSKRHATFGNHRFLDPVCILYPVFICFFLCFNLSAVCCLHFILTLLKTCTGLIWTSRTTSIFPQNSSSLINFNIFDAHSTDFIEFSRHKSRTLGPILQSD